MATYYNLFALGKQLSPVVSVPYIDAFGTGTVNRFFMDLCRAVYMCWSIYGTKKCLDKGRPSVVRKCYTKIT